MNYISKIENFILKTSYNFGNFLKLQSPINSRIYSVAIPVICLFQEAIKIISDLERVCFIVFKLVVKFRLESGNIQYGVTHVCEHIRNIAGIVFGIFVGIISPRVSGKTFLIVESKNLLDILNPKTSSRLYASAYHFAKFFNNHKIDYRICSGTMLGARRHKGVIPWDDDMDVMLHPNSVVAFEKLVKDGIFKLETGMEIEAQSFTESWECFHPENEKGIGFLKNVGAPFIDIFKTKFDKNKIVIDSLRMRLISTEEYYTVAEWNDVEEYDFGPLKLPGIKNPEHYLYRSYGGECLEYAYQTMHHEKLNEVAAKPWDICGMFSKIWEYGLPRRMFITQFHPVKYDQELYERLI